MVRRAICVHPGIKSGMQRVDVVQGSRIQAARADLPPGSHIASRGKMAGGGDN